MKLFIKWLPKFYLLLAILLYCLPDHPFLLVLLLIPAVSLILFNWTWLRISVGVLLALLTFLLFFAWISEIREFNRLSEAWQLIIGGTVLLISNGYMAWHFLTQHDSFSMLNPGHHKSFGEKGSTTH